MFGSAFDYDVLAVLQDNNESALDLVQQASNQGDKMDLLLGIAVVVLALAIAIYFEVRRTRQLAQATFLLLRDLGGDGDGGGDAPGPETFAQGVASLRRAAALAGDRGPGPRP